MRRVDIAGSKPGRSAKFEYLEYAGLSRFPGEKRKSVNVELPGVPLSPCAAEGIDGSPDFDVLESGFPEHPFPACARQPPGDSTPPEVGAGAPPPRAPPPPPLPRGAAGKRVPPPRQPPHPPPPGTMR